MIKGVARLLEEIMNASSDGKSHESVLTNNMNQIEIAQMAMFHPVIRPENRLNAVVVRDVSSRMPMYEKLIKTLDVPQKLVEIQVTTVELSRKDALDWQLSLAVSGNKSAFTGAAGQNAANLFAPDDLAGKGLAGSLTHIHSAYSIAASLTALREKGKVRSISRTSLLTINNLAAEMTDSQSYHAKVVGTEVASLEEVTAGTKLQIKPRVVPSPGKGITEQVWLSMRLDDGGFEAVTVDAMPMTRSSTLQTQTAVFADESIMLAGYMRDIEEDAGWGIPYLRDIPLIGWLFGGKYTHKETVQRMFILTPHVIDLDVQMLARLQATRLRDITEEEKLADDAEASDGERKKRELEREDANARREERDKQAYKRREAEIKHEREMRKIARKREEKKLNEDIEVWLEEEEAEEKKND